MEAETPRPASGGKPAARLQLVMNDQPTPAKKAPRIVLLEDEPALSRLFEQCLREWFTNIELVKFANGAEAWRELSRTKPDLLILDWVHPGMTGEEILKQLALDRARYPILLTSEFFEEHLQLFCEQGLKLAFLPKPFGLREFWTALNQLVGPSDHPEIQALVSSQAEPRLPG